MDTPDPTPELLARATPGSILVLRAPSDTTEEVAARIADALDRTEAAVHIVIADDDVTLDAVLPPGTIPTTAPDPDRTDHGQPALIQVDEAQEGPGWTVPGGEAGGCGCRCSCMRRSVDTGCAVHGTPDHHLRYGRQSGCALDPQDGDGARARTWVRAPDPEEGVDAGPQDPQYRELLDGPPDDQRLGVTGRCGPCRDGELHAFVAVAMNRDWCPACRLADALSPTAEVGHHERCCIGART